MCKAYNCLMIKLFFTLYELSSYLKFEKLAYFFFLKTIQKTELITPIIHLQSQPSLIVMYDSGVLYSNMFLIKPPKNALDIN